MSYYDESNIVRISMLKPERTTWQIPDGYKWHPFAIKKITGHKLIDSELCKLANQFKSFIRSRLILLGWLKPEMREEFNITATTVNLDNIVTAVMESQYNFHLLSRGESRYILVGRDYFPKVMNAVQDDMLSFQMGFPDRYRAQVHERTSSGIKEYPYLFRGMTVVFIPWMNGLVLLPELNQGN